MNIPNWMCNPCRIWDTVYVEAPNFYNAVLGKDIVKFPLNGIACGNCQEHYDEMVYAEEVIKHAYQR